MKNSTTNNPNFTFFDFCSGIGGGRIAAEENLLKCVGHSEINQIASSTYDILFPNSKNFGDVMTLKVDELPDFDLMIAGFPCQTFSIAGKRLGLEDTRGQIIYGLLNIIKIKQPKIILFENVKGLVNHANGQSLKEIIKLFEDLGYVIDFKVLNTLNFGIPQMRERVYIIGIKKEYYQNPINWETNNIQPKALSEFLSSDNNDILQEDDVTFLRYLNNKYNNNSLTIKDLLTKEGYIVDRRQSDLRIYKDKIPTLRANRHGLCYIRDSKLIKLNGKEALKLQGFPENLISKLDKQVSNSSLLTLAGNAMTVNVMSFLIKEIINNLKMDKQIKGSMTAKAGFQNEKDIAFKFNNWINDTEAKKWLEIMNYKLDEIEYVTAKIITKAKADLNVQIQVKLKSLIDTENIQVKLVSNEKGFNQINKRWLKNYSDWNIPKNVLEILRYFLGESKPYKISRSEKRMFMDEFSVEESSIVINWLKENKLLILSDVIKGRGQFSAEWFLVIKKYENDNNWVLRNINEVLNHYSQGSVEITKKGSIKIGSVTIQRKGGDNGRDTANMLQFKLDPTELF